MMTLLNIFLLQVFLLEDQLGVSLTKGDLLFSKFRMHCENHAACGLYLSFARSSSKKDAMHA